MGKNTKKIFFCLSGCLIIFLPAVFISHLAAAEYRVEQNGLPLYFIPNQGQVHSEVQFYAKASGYTLGLTKKGLIFGNKYASALFFKGSNKDPEMLALDLTSHRVNVIKGKDRSKWRMDIPTFCAVKFASLYPQIDLKVYGKERAVEYDWIIKPGGEVANIRFVFADVNETTIDKNGNLLVKTERLETQHLKPVCFQFIKGKKHLVNADFARIEGDEFGFSVDDYDKNYDLIIDPYILVYSSYIGGSGEDVVEDIAVDKKGALYICGSTKSLDLPVKKAVQDYNAGWIDAYIYKVKPNGKGLVYATYLGGVDYDSAFGICVDKKGAAYITGVTDSSDFPTKNAFDDEFGAHRDGFVLKLNPAGNQLEFSTFLGGFGDDQSIDIALDSKGAIFVTGATESLDFPVKNALQSQLNQFKDAFVTKINKNGKDLVYSTYLGGAHVDYGTKIVVDKTGAIIVAGTSFSVDFPTKKALQSELAGMLDSIVFKINPSGNSLVFSTYLGGTAQDHLRGLAVDKKGRIWVSGYTYSEDFPTQDPFQAKRRRAPDIYVTQLNKTGQALRFSTYLGGKGIDYSLSLAIDSVGNVWITGVTTSNNFPIRSPLQKKPKKGSNIIISMFSAQDHDLIFSTYFGGSKGDEADGIIIDNSDSVYISGTTQSRNFPLLNPFQKKHKGGNLDSYVLKLKKLK